MARKKKLKTEDFWARLSHNWDWLDSVTSFFTGAPVWGPLALWIWGPEGTAGRLVEAAWSDLVIVFVMGVLLSRLTAVARWPRKVPLDYNKITVGGAAAANSLTIIMGIALIICTLALVAPGVLELLAKNTPTP